MKRLVVFLMLMTGVCAGWPLAGGESGKAGEEDPSAAVMQAWARYGTPGEQHAFIARRAGVWEVEVTFWPRPGMPPEVSKGRTECTLIMGGRYLLEKFEGTAMGQPFQGLGLLGYDNLKKAFVATWIDSQSTGIFYTEGQPDADGKTVRYVGDMPDPVTGKFRKSRSVEVELGPDARRMDSYDLGPDGKEFKNMEMVYKRVK